MLVEKITFVTGTATTLTLDTAINAWGERGVFALCTLTNISVRIGIIIYVAILAICNLQKSKELKMRSINIYESYFLIAFVLVRSDFISKTLLFFKIVDSLKRAELAFVPI